MKWEPYAAMGSRLRVQETSCCGEYELAAEGGQYLVLRPAGESQEETARGSYARAARAFAELTAPHRCVRSTGLADVDQAAT